MRDWLAIRGDAPGPLFLRINKAGRIANAGMTPQAIYNMLNKRATAAGGLRPTGSCHHGDEPSTACGGGVGGAGGWRSCGGCDGCCGVWCVASWHAARRPSSAAAAHPPPAPQSADGC